MPTHHSAGYDAAALSEVVKHVEELGEDVVAVVSAGNVWSVITKRKPKPGRPPKTPQERA